MSVYKHAKSPFFQYDFQFKGRRFHGSTSCTSKRDAQRFEAEERRKVALGDDTKPAITVNDACGTWWTERGQYRRDAGTLDYQLAALIKGLGKNVLLGDVTLRDFDRHVARRRNGRANASVNREVQVARTVWRYIAARDFDVAPIEWKSLFLPEKPEHVRELSEAEESRLFDALPDNLLPLVSFALMTGQRLSEVRLLRWADVDLGAGRATLSVKGGGKHTIPLLPDAVALIANQPKVCPQVFTYVCLRPAPAKAGQARRLKGERYPFSRDGWRRHWMRALEVAGIEAFRFHDLRHTRATRTLRGSGNLRAVQKLLNHTDLKTTARYAHALEDDVRAALVAGNHRNSPEPTSSADAVSRSRARR